MVTYFSIWCNFVIINFTTAFEKGHGDGFSSFERGTTRRFRRQSLTFSHEYAYILCDYDKINDEFVIIFTSL